MITSPRYLLLADIALRGSVRLTDKKLRERRKNLLLFKAKVHERKEEVIRAAREWRAKHE